MTRGPPGPHGEAPRLRRDLHASLNKTVNTTASGERCWAVAAEASARSAYAPWARASAKATAEHIDLIRWENR